MSGQQSVAHQLVGGDQPFLLGRELATLDRVAQNRQRRTRGAKQCQWVQDRVEIQENSPAVDVIGNQGDRILGATSPPQQLKL